MREKNEDENIEINTYMESDLDICIDIDTEIKNHKHAMTLWLELFSQQTSTVPKKLTYLFQFGKGFLLSAY